MSRLCSTALHLWGWIDFGAHQIFDEATVYTALQFFSRRANDAVSVVPGRRQG
jgi:hypothetical protein